VNIWHSYGQKGGLCHALSLSLSSVVARLTKCTSVSVWGHNYEPHKNGWTDRGAVWDTDSGGTKHALCVGLALPGRKVNLRGVSRPMVKWREYSACIRYSQPYSIAGSRDVAFRCQYTAATYYLNAWTAGLSSRVVSASDCGVRGSRFESRHWQLCLSRRLLRYRVLSTGCAPLLQCLGGLSLPPFVGR